jgi:carboxyl-terminal processing protease
MDDGAAIILSVAKYYTPDGKSIQDNGITPANQLADTEPTPEVDENGEPLPAAPEQKPPAQKKLEDDPMVKKALELLK